MSLESTLHSASRHIVCSRMHKHCEGFLCSLIFDSFHEFIQNILCFGDSGVSWLHVGVVVSEHKTVCYLWKRIKGGFIFDSYLTARQLATSVNNFRNEHLLAHSPGICCLFRRIYFVLVANLRRNERLSGRGQVHESLDARMRTKNKGNQTFFARNRKFGLFYWNISEL